MDQYGENMEVFEAVCLHSRLTEFANTGPQKHLYNNELGHVRAVISMSDVVMGPCST